MKKKTKREETLIVYIGIVVIGIILIFQLAIFHNYKRNLIELQEDNMLNTAKAVANNLKTFYDENTKAFSLFFLTGKTREEMEAFFNMQEEITSLMIIKEDGTLQTQLGIDYQEWIPQLLLQYQEVTTDMAYLLPPILTSDRHYTHFMMKKMHVDEEVYFAVGTMELPATYELIVKPIQIGEYGYSMVKNLEGVILMHKAVNQIGIDAVDGRKKQYEEFHLDLTDLELWINQQKNNPEGSRILESYWWGEHDPIKSQKVVAYTHIQIGSEIWIINCTLDYNEINTPLKQAQQYVFWSSVILVIGFGLLYFWIVMNINKNQQIQIEIKHLKEMNEAWEELHKRDEQLRHTDKIKTLGTMTSMISHEFNNYLTPILIYSELLEQDPAIGKQEQEYAGEILEAATKASDLTKELSLYGRTDRTLYKKEMISISEEIERSVSMLKKTLPDHIKLVEEIEPVSGYGVLAAKGMINQIIVNLSTNSMHAMKEEGGVIYISGRMLSGESQLQYVITVKDNGCGIPEEQVKQIFTPFFTTKEAGKGTGLGLSIVHDLVYQSSGDIQVISNEGQGTRFDILFPLAKIQESESIMTDTEHILEGKNILVLDDSEKVTKALLKSLKQECGKVNIFQRPEEALTQIKKDINFWDIVITDYGMPVMNGLEFASILRGLGYQNTIVLISGCLDQDIQWYLDCKMIDLYLEKPISITELKNGLSS